MSRGSIPGGDGPDDGERSAKIAANERSVRVGGRAGGHALPGGKQPLACTPNIFIFLIQTCPLLKEHCLRIFWFQELILRCFTVKSRNAFFGKVCQGNSFL